MNKQFLVAYRINHHFDDDFEDKLISINFIIFKNYEVPRVQFVIPYDFYTSCWLKTTM